MPGSRPTWATYQPCSFEHVTSPPLNLSFLVSKMGTVTSQSGGKKHRHQEHGAFGLVLAHSQPSVNVSDYITAQR